MWRLPSRVFHMSPRPGYTMLTSPTSYFMKREAFTKGTLILNGITSSVSGDHFVTGAKDNTRFKRMLSRSADKTTGVRYERIGKPETFSPAKACPDKLRRVRHYTANNNNRTFIFLTNNTGLKAEEIAMLCRKRREAELFSNGLNSICQSNPFWGGQPWMLSKSKSAVRSLLIVWLPSSVTNWKWTVQSANWKSTKWNFTDPRYFFAR